MHVTLAAEVGFARLRRKRMPPARREVTWLGREAEPDFAT
jgi:hypothetical protein